MDDEQSKSFEAEAEQFPPETVAAMIALLRKVRARKEAAERAAAERDTSTLSDDIRAESPQPSIGRPESPQSKRRRIRARLNSAAAPASSARAAGEEPVRLPWVTAPSESAETRAEPAEHDELDDDVVKEEYLSEGALGQDRDTPMHDINDDPAFAVQVPAPANPAASPASSPGKARATHAALIAQEREALMTDPKYASCPELGGWFRLKAELEGSRGTAAEENARRQLEAYESKHGLPIPFKTPLDDWLRAVQGHSRDDRPEITHAEYCEEFEKTGRKSRPAETHADDLGAFIDQVGRTLAEGVCCRTCNEEGRDCRVHAGFARCAACARGTGKRKCDLGPPQRKPAADFPRGRNDYGAQSVFINTLTLNKKDVYDLQSDHRAIEAGLNAMERAMGPARGDDDNRVVYLREALAKVRAAWERTAPMHARVHTFSRLNAEDEGHLVDVPRPRGARRVGIFDDQRDPSPIPRGEPKVESVLVTRGRPSGSGAHGSPSGSGTRGPAHRTGRVVGGTAAVIAGIDVIEIHDSSSDNESEQPVRRRRRAKKGSKRTRCESVSDD